MFVRKVSKLGTYPKFNFEQNFDRVIILSEILNNNQFEGEYQTRIEFRNFSNKHRLIVILLKSIDFEISALSEFSNKHRFSVEFLLTSSNKYQISKFSEN